MCVKVLFILSYFIYILYRKRYRMWCDWDDCKM